MEQQTRFLREKRDHVDICQNKNNVKFSPKLFPSFQRQVRFVWVRHIWVQLLGRRVRLRELGVRLRRRARALQRGLRAAAPPLRPRGLRAVPALPAPARPRRAAPAAPARTPVPLRTLRTLQTADQQIRPRLQRRVPEDQRRFRKYGSFSHSSCTHVCACVCLCVSVRVCGRVSALCACV